MNIREGHGNGLLEINQEKLLTWKWSDAILKQEAT